MCAMYIIKMYVQRRAEDGGRRRLKKRKVFKFKSNQRDEDRRFTHSLTHAVTHSLTFALV